MKINFGLLELFLIEFSVMMAVMIPFMMMRPVIGNWNVMRHRNSIRDWLVNWISDRNFHRVGNVVGYSDLLHNCCVSMCTKWNWSWMMMMMCWWRKWRWWKWSGICRSMRTMSMIMIQRMVKELIAMRIRSMMMSKSSVADNTSFLFFRRFSSFTNVSGRCWTCHNCLYQSEYWTQNHDFHLRNFDEILYSHYLTEILRNIPKNSF